VVNLNRVILAGNLTRDPELRYTPGGQAVTKFGIAINRVYLTQNGERKEEVDYIPVVVWGKQAESCSQFLSKGRPVLVDGRLRYRSWETTDGQKRSAIEVVAFRVQFLGPQPREVLEREVEGVPPEPIITDEEEEEVPF
jgi:single-strand DNA-binding protein